MYWLIDPIVIILFKNLYLLLNVSWRPIFTPDYSFLPRSIVVMPNGERNVTFMLCQLRLGSCLLTIIRRPSFQIDINGTRTLLTYLILTARLSKINKIKLAPGLYDTCTCINKTSMFALITRLYKCTSDFLQQGNTKYLKN